MPTAIGRTFYANAIFYLLSQCIPLEYRLVMAVLTTGQTKFLYLLAYMYMQQSKYAQALQLLRILRLHTAENMQIALTLAFCLYKASRLEEATKVLNSLDINKLSISQKTAYYFISSKVLWDLKKVTESREMLHNYLKCRKLNS